MTRPIDAEERAWALECLAAGDTLAEVAEWSGRTADEWRPVVGFLAKRISDAHRERLSLASAGVTQAAIADELGCSRKAVAQSLMSLRLRGVPVPFGTADARGART